jgi:hypothetical protein
LVIVTIFYVEYNFMLNRGRGVFLGEKERGRKGEKEKGRKGEKEKGRKGEKEKGEKRCAVCGVRYVVCGV